MSDNQPIIDQPWVIELAADGIYLTGEDGTRIAKLCRPDRGSDIFMTGYIVALQAMQLAQRNAGKVEATLVVRKHKDT